LIRETYLFNGRFHNPKGPAYRQWNSSGQLIIESYWINGEYHNPKGPAFREWNSSGQLIYEAYWLHGKKVTKEDLNKTSCSGKIVEIDGKKYKLQEVK
jgi:hypothetical protein